ncbi:hypothetical protein BDF20DRAFT_821169 [Mycotypha africana]|uniref:uncharacterized protein n=1 Tax=Mycotypha africana TaxID=64632 RepID=UPI0023006506|nr:uncharacterized protein BDF20DRAFT_821169 [Mycotypha africana]KAI8977462.1 hypothetical protein BDF20DRAFT_821169 [Mycotypha africana]
MPSLKWRHIHINHKTLSIITSQKYPGNTYREQVEVFHRIFNLYTFGYSSVDDIVNDREIKLKCTAQSDGHGITLQFVRRKATSGNTKALLQLDDFNLVEVGEYFHPITVDPGRNEIFTAAVGFNNVNHEIRSCSKSERANFAGYTRRSTYSKKLKEKKGITSIESSLPSPKVVSKEAYIVYLKYTLQHLQTLFDFYSFKSAQFNFNNYQGKQRADAEVANVLIDGGRKYNRRKRKHTNRNKKRKRRLKNGQKKTIRSKVKKTKRERMEAQEEKKKKTIKEEPKRKEDVDLCR